MSKLKSEFRVVFRDYPDEWEFILYTDHPMSADEVESLVLYWTEVNDRNFSVYTPVDIMDDLCENKGWEWADGDYEDIYIANWKKSGGDKA